jgi:hypothetical protein
MTGYVTFEARIEPMVWGRATYTILRLPPEIVAQLGDAKRVEGELNEHPVNLAPTRVPVIEDAFLWAGQSLLGRVGVAVGDVVELRLCPADALEVAVDDDILSALRAGGVMGGWGQLTPGKQRGLLYQIASAKTPATRQKRIAKLIEGLRA